MSLFPPYLLIEIIVKIKRDKLLTPVFLSIPETKKNIGGWTDNFCNCWGMVESVGRLGLV